MAKKHFGKLLTLAAIVGAAAAGVSYVLQYKSFHKELDEDFHDFEDDFDDFDDAEDTGDVKSENAGTTERSYVSLTPDKKETSSEKEVTEEAVEEADVKPEAPAKTASTEETAASDPEASERKSDDTATVTVEEVTE